MFRADVTMTEGLDDCFPQVSPGGTPAKVEWVGYANGTWWRGTGGPTSENGTITLDKDTITLVNQVTDLEVAVGGTMQFDVNGTFTLADAEGDRMNGWVPPATYACGWPKANPPAYTGDYAIVKGQQVPDGVFHDTCDEVVRLHDLQGTYMIIDMAAIDCPPCQSMAAGAEQFVTDMKAQGIDVRMVTLLAPSLSDTLSPTSTAKLKTWTTKYGLTSPVLSDRGWGLSMFIPLFSDQVGYPSWVVVDPNLNVVDYGTGFGDYTDFEQIILADMP
jgi:peroxiredoxin